MLKHLLLGTTVLVTAAVAASAAMAQTAGPKAPFTVYLNGDASSYIGFQSGQNNNGSNNFPAPGTAVNSHGRSYGIVNNAEGKFTFRAKADNGMAYGFYVRFPLTSDSTNVLGFAIDREKLFFQNPGVWGFFFIGNDSGTGKDGFPETDPLWGGYQQDNGLGPDQGIEQVFYSDPNAIAIDGVLHKSGSDAMFGTGRSTHLMYKTRPFLSDEQGGGVEGLQFAIDFSPDGTSRAEDVFLTSTTNQKAIAVSSSSGTRLQNIIGADFHDSFAINEKLSGEFGMNVVWAQSKDTAALVPSSSGVLGGTIGQTLQYGTWREATTFTYFGKSDVSQGVPAAPAGVASVENKPTTWGYSLMLEQTSISAFQPTLERGNRSGISNIAEPDAVPVAGDWSWGPYYVYGRAPGPFGDNGVIEVNYYGLGGAYWLAKGLYVTAEAHYYSDWNTHAFTGDPARFQSGTAAGARNPHGQVYILATTVYW